MIFHGPFLFKKKKVLRASITLKTFACRIQFLRKFLPDSGVRKQGCCIRIQTFFLHPLFQCRHCNNNDSNGVKAILSIKHDLRNVRAELQCFLYGSWSHIFPIFQFILFFQSSCNVQVAIIIQSPYITCTQASISSKRLFCYFWKFVIALHDVVSIGNDFTLIFCNSFNGLIYFNSCIRNRSSHRAETYVFRGID